jgi:SNF2 family DNA or RNA helicase
MQGDNPFIMKLTDYHAKYYAHELTKRCSSDSLEKLAASLADAQVDLNPHQVDAALFAFRSPLSRGAILADEVGLGKTIEAGIVLSQIWAERKRKILIIVPSSLRKQWNQELLEKFFLPSTILESKSFNQHLKNVGTHCNAPAVNPFEQNEIIITSYQFARNKAEQIKDIKWDLVVIDEAHRLRNVYKTSNKIARALKEALAHAPKLLLTATPLQNSLMELYGLVGFIDDYIFGDIKSYKNQFARLTNEINFDELKARIAPICKRTLRRQVLEYIKYPMDKTFGIFDKLEANGLFDPRNMAKWSYDELFDRLIASGYDRGKLTDIFGERIWSLSRLVDDYTANEKILTEGTEQEIVNLLSKIKGLGPVVLKNYMLLRGK